MDILDGKIHLKKPVQLNCGIYFDDGTSSGKIPILFEDYIEVINLDDRYMILDYNNDRYIYWFGLSNVSKKDFIDNYYNDKIKLRDDKIKSILS